VDAELVYRKILKKKYFRIGETGKIVGVESHVLRYWETEFTIIKPYRPKSGQRLYRKKDVKNFIRIKTLLHDEGYTVAGAIKILNREKSGGDGGIKIPEKAGSSHTDNRLVFIKGELQAIMDCFGRNEKR
jgi:DNA-binding transcriptional MerR regulator